MKFIPLALKDARIIIPEAHSDDRGLFARIFCEEELQAIGHTKRIVQINHSRTVRKGAIRGMHFQHPPKSEIKIIRCIRGSVFDVIIDLRKNSQTFLQWHGENLSRENMKMMYAPEGFAHGFQALDDNSELLYFHTEFYDPASEGAVRFDDPRINIQWSIEITDISKRDSNHPYLTDDFQGIEL